MSASETARAASFGVGLEDHDLLDAGHPVEEIGVFVRDDARHRMSHPAEHLGPGKGRSDGIPVGIGMGEDDDTLRGTRKQFPQAFDMIFRQFHRLTSHWWTRQRYKKRAT